MLQGTRYRKHTTGNTLQRTRYERHTTEDALQRGHYMGRILRDTLQETHYTRHRVKSERQESSRKREPPIHVWVGAIGTPAILNAWFASLDHRAVLCLWS